MIQLHFYYVRPVLQTINQFQEHTTKYTNSTLTNSTKKVSLAFYNMKFLTNYFLIQKKVQKGHKIRQAK